MGPGSLPTRSRHGGVAVSAMAQADRRGVRYRGLGWGPARCTALVALTLCLNFVIQLMNASRSGQPRPASSATRAPRRIWPSAS